MGETRLPVLFSSILVLVMIIFDMALRINAFVLPASILCLLNILSTNLLPKNYTAVMVNVWTFSHKSLLVLSYTIFGLAFILGFFYLIGQFLLKKAKKGSVLEEIPPLETISTINIAVIFSGVVLFTTGIVIGYLYGRQVFNPGWRLDIVVILSALVWVVYVVTLVSSLFPGIKGKRIALGSVLGFMILYATLFASELFSKVHTFR
jgi:ABC-type uncharacterized transport system permease subunit